MSRDYAEICSFSGLWQAEPRALTVNRASIPQLHLPCHRYTLITLFYTQNVLEFSPKALTVLENEFISEIDFHFMEVILSSLLDSLYFPNKYLCFSHGNYHVALNSANCKSRKFLKDEYAYFNKLLLLKQDSTRGIAVQWIEENPDAFAFVKQMIVSGMVSMKPFMENKRSGVRGKPLAAYWGVSSRCNFRCRYCYAACGAPVKETPQTYLTPQENRRMGSYSLVLLNSP